MHAKIFILVLLTVLGLTIGQKTTEEICKSIKIQCVCGIEENRKFVPLELKMFAIKDSRTGRMKCSDYPDPYQACANISCAFVLNNSTSEANSKDFISNFYPKEFTILRGDVIKGSRFARDISECHVTPLKNAEVKCWEYPSSVTCEITCVYGYGLKSSRGTMTSSSVSCQRSENIWRPHGFYDCLPYLNCNVQLGNPGKVKCVEQINDPAYCDIACHEYAQYDEIPLQRYDCVDDNFQNNLPYCASLKENVKLIQKP